MVIPLGNGFFTVIDDKNFYLIDGKRLTLTETEWTYYVTVYSDSNNVFLHRLIMGEPFGMVVHHIDGNGCNNRENNLVVLTNSQHKYRHTRPAYLDLTLNDF